MYHHPDGAARTPLSRSPVPGRRSRRPAGVGLGLQIGPKLKIGGSVGKVLGNVQKAVSTAVVDTGHAIGKVATNPIVEGLEAGALAVTGVGLPVAAGLLAAQKGFGNLIKPGGNLKSAGTGVYQGAITGAIAAEAFPVAKGAFSIGKSVASDVGGSLVSEAKKLFGGTPGPAPIGTSTTPGRPPTNGEAGAIGSFFGQPGTPGSTITTVNAGQQGRRGRGATTTTTAADPGVAGLINSLLGGTPIGQAAGAVFSGPVQTLPQESTGERIGDFVKSPAGILTGIVLLVLLTRKRS